MLINVDSSCCERAQNLERTSISIDTRWTSANWNGFDVIKQRTLETWNTQQTLTIVWIFTHTHRHIDTFTHNCNLEFVGLNGRAQKIAERIYNACMIACVDRVERQRNIFVCVCVSLRAGERGIDKGQLNACMVAYIFELSITIEKAKQIKNYQTIFLHANIIRMEIN